MNSSKSLIVTEPLFSVDEDVSQDDGSVLFKQQVPLTTVLSDEGSHSNCTDVALIKYLVITTPNRNKYIQ